MKEKYTPAELTVIDIYVADIITSSDEEILDPDGWT